MLSHQPHETPCLTLERLTLAEWLPRFLYHFRRERNCWEARHGGGGKPGVLVLSALSLVVCTIAHLCSVVLISSSHTTVAPASTPWRHGVWTQVLLLAQPALYPLSLLSSLSPMASTSGLFLPSFPPGKGSRVCVNPANSIWLAFLLLLFLVPISLLKYTKLSVLFIGPWSRWLYRLFQTEKHVTSKSCVCVFQDLVNDIKPVNKQGKR